MKVSIIITTYNRGGHLRRGLQSLFTRCTKPDDVEVLIIDDGSTDETERVYLEFRDQKEFKDWNIRYIYNRNPGYLSCSLAKNIGIKQAKGELLIFTEPEILYVTDMISQHLTWQEKGNYLISAGIIYFVFSKKVTSLTWQELQNPKLITERSEVQEWGTDFPDIFDIRVRRNEKATYCASVRKENLMRIGGWDQGFKRWGFDDLDAIERLGKIGVKNISDNNIICVHLAHGMTGLEWFEESKRYHERPNKPTIANQGMKWGEIKK